MTSDPGGPGDPADPGGPARMTRVAVIGAGVIGAAIAWRLSADGHVVTLIDSRPGGSPRAARSAG